MWQVFPVYRVRTGSRHEVSKYRSSKELTCYGPVDLIPASVNVTTSWVLKVATMTILERPVEMVWTTTNLTELLRC
jgi:hypothetical protein